jgi:uncharacterized protein YceH (UPF0502 family)
MTDATEQERPAEDPNPELTPVEARVLGCLMEKQRTTPDAYPLTLNSLVQACNQKSSRNPVMRLEPNEVGHVVNQLRDRDLIHASFAGRVERYDHKMASNYHLNRQEQALMCALMLRGPQTEGELRIHAGRMAEFADLKTVAALLAGLGAREPPLVVKLARLPGKREDRYGQLLCGAIEQQEPAAAAAAIPAAARDNRVETLAAQVQEMREELNALWELTGLAGRRPDK